MSALRKVQKTFKTSWFQRRRESSAEVQAEIRDDYTVKTFRGHSEGVLAVLLAPTGPISASSDGTVKVWNTFSSECMVTLAEHTGWVNVIELYDDDKLVSGSYDKNMKLWDLNRGVKLHTLRGHKGSISCLLVRDARNIISGSYDSTLNLWDTRHHKKVSGR